MTEESLERAIQIKDRLDVLKEEITKMEKSTGAIRLKQRNYNGGDDMNIEVNENEKLEIDKQTRTVLLAAKQTIRSIYEMEIERLEKELKNL